MRIKFQQLDDQTRKRIGVAILDYAENIKRNDKEARRKFILLGMRIIHGELILGEYQYNEQEKGGE